MTEAELDSCIHKNGYSGIFMVEFEDGEFIMGSIFKFEHPVLSMGQDLVFDANTFYFLKADDVIKYHNGMQYGHPIPKEMLRKITPDEIKKIMLR